MRSRRGPIVQSLKPRLSFLSRSFILTTSSRQNLDSIVEAIRHLEGDHLFSEEQQVAKEEVVEYMPADISSAKLSFNPIVDQTGSGGSIFIINKN